MGSSILPEISPNRMGSNVWILVENTLHCELSTSDHEVDSLHMKEADEMFEEDSSLRNILFLIFLIFV